MWGTPYAAAPKQTQYGGWAQQPPVHQTQQQTSNWAAPPPPVQQQQQNQGGSNMNNSGKGQQGGGNGQRKGKGKGKGKFGKGGKRKPAKKKAKGMTPEQREATFKTQAMKVAPTICEAIDKRGGFCSLGDIALEPKVVAALKGMPDGFKKTAKAVIDKFPDFFSFFKGGRVATAKGYEKGLVNPDGTVNDANVKAMKKEKAPENKAPKPLKPQKDLSTFDNDKSALNYLINRLPLVAKRGTDAEFKDINQQIKALRKKMEAQAEADRAAGITTKKKSKGGGNAEPIVDNSAGMSQADLIETVVQIVRSFEKEDKIAYSMNICNCREAKEIRNALAEHHCRKMGNIFKRFPQTFELDSGKPESIGQIVKIKSSYKKGMQQTPVEIIDPKREAWLEKKRLMAEEAEKEK